MGREGLRRPFCDLYLENVKRLINEALRPRRAETMRSRKRQAEKGVLS